MSPLPRAERYVGPAPDDDYLRVDRPPMLTPHEVTELREIVTRFTAPCDACKRQVLAGTRAWWVPKRGIWHKSCMPDPSAAQPWRRATRKAARDLKRAKRRRRESAGEKAPRAKDTGSPEP